MPIYNLVETLHNKWLLQYRNEMTCGYETKMDNLIYEFMQIINYRLWFRGGFISKGLHYASLKLKVVAMCRYPKLMANATKFYSRT
jgi:hypothetical protein